MKTYNLVLSDDQPQLVTHIAPVASDNLVGDRIDPDSPLFGVIWINEDRLSGAPCFYATRVPVKALFDCLAAGQSLDEFLDDFEGVTREQAQVVLRLGCQSLLDRLPPA